MKRIFIFAIVLCMTLSIAYAATYTQQQAFDATKQQVKSAINVTPLSILVSNNQLIVTYSYNVFTKNASVYYTQQKTGTFGKPINPIIACTNQSTVRNCLTTHFVTPYKSHVSAMVDTQYQRLQSEKFLTLQSINQSAIIDMLR